MRNVAIAVVLLIAVGQSKVHASDPKSSCLIIHEVLNTLRPIHPGDTRQELLADFDEDGGLQNAIHTRYVFKRCRSIKVDVEFDVNPENKRFDSLRSDKIVRISKPYLEPPAYD
jgi:hypothetical protein